MTQAQVLAETKTISLDAGRKTVVVGANDAGVAKFRAQGEDRCEFMNVGEVKQASTLHGKNIQFVIVNGRIPDEVQERVQTLADRAQVQTVYMVANSAALQRMAEAFPMRNKGVITFDVPEVMQTIELHAPVNPPPGPKPPPPPDSLKPPPQGPQPPPPPSSNPPDPKPLTLNDALGKLEQFYDQCGGDHKKTIVYFRSLGFREEVITHGALYQRILTIRSRRKKNGQPSTVGVAVPAELLASGKVQELLDAIESAKEFQRRVLELAAEVAAENAQLRDITLRQAEELKGLPAMRTELNDLREKAEKARVLFAANNPQ